jgi:hypothetical protein
MDRVTIKREELEARIDELRTERVFRAVYWAVLGAGVIVALAVAVSLYIAR